MATINHKTYNEATETFKDFSVYDGKETLIFKVDGADQTVYASNIIGSGIIKTSDNGPLSATAKYLSDGLGNNSALALSTSLVGVGATTLFTKMSIANSLSATSIGTNYNAGILNIQNTNTTNGNLSLIGFQDASASINLAAVGAINTVHSASPNSVVGELGFYTKASGGGYVTERMRISSTGNVGIGTSTPAAKLDVNQTNQSGDNDFIRLTTDATSGSLSLGIYPSSNNSLSFIGSNALFSAGGVTRLNAAAGGSLLSMNTDSIVTYVSSGAANPVERMRIDSSGNVGINTSAPTQKLTVNGNAAVGGQQAFWLRDDDGFSANAARRAWAMTANYNAFGTFSIYGASAVDSDPLAGTAFLNITSAGNVGIGTSTPTTAKLQIRGTGNTDATNSIFADNSSGAATFAVRDNGDVFMLGNVGIGTGTPTGKLHISGDGAAANLIRLQNTGSGTNGFFDISVTSTDAQLVANYSTTAIPMLFLTGAAERMRITSAGAVGIGTTSPVSKFHVSGADAWMTLQRTSGTTNILDFTDSAAARLGYVGFIFSNLTLNAKAGSDIVFAPNNEERGRFTSNGLTFNGDTAAANALDDYEEGTWTPSVAFGGASVGLTYGRRGGTYTKIGRQVTVCGDLILSAKGSSTGNATIAGLPFTINGSSTDFLQAASFRFAEMSFSGLVQGYGGVSSTIINMEQVTSGAGAASITDADFEDGTQLMVSLTYFV
jgi:hypothetical protein